MADQEKAKPVYDNFEISGCREHDDGAGPYVEPCDDAEAQFWTLYGHIDGQGVEAIGDFRSRKAAEEVYFRIVGHAFGSHEENEATARLIHAASALLEVLEPYAIEAKNRINIANANGSEVTDEIEAVMRPLLTAYANASAQPAGAAAVTRQIERLLAADFMPEWDTDGMNPTFVAVTSEISSRFVRSWPYLTLKQQTRALEKHVDWDGFDWGDIHSVSRKVVDGSPKEQWFAEVDTFAADPLALTPGPVTGHAEEVMSSEAEQKFFAEWREDYATHRGDDRREREGVPTAGPRESWPSEIAKAQRQKKGGQDRSKSGDQQHSQSKDDGFSM